MDVVLAGDIGGTKMAAGVVRRDGTILARCTTATPTATDGATLYSRFSRLLGQALSQSGLDRAAVGAIGVGCGGPMRLPQGEVSPLNIPAWRDFPLRARLEEEFGRPALIDNDAKAFALGEHWVGGGRGFKCLLAMVVSTGVGGGIVEQGRLVDGAHGNAGHIGHVVVVPNGPPCACGARGCLEAVASGRSLARDARLAMAAGQRSALPPEPTGSDLSAAASAGDRLALRLFQRAGVALGRGIATAAALFDLDRVIIGGGVAGASEFFLPALRREYDARARLGFVRDLTVEVSQGTVEAALVGAARLALELTADGRAGTTVGVRA
jgi:glucokinase